MKWSFCITTDGLSPDRVIKIVESIEAENIPEGDYEIIVIGGNPIGLPVVKNLSFDDSTRRGWITRKKNILAQAAKFDNLVIMHDYLSLVPGWYAAFEKFGDDWDVAMCKIAQPDGIRFRDWVLWKDGVHFVDYADHSQIRDMYVSGSLMIVKKQFMIERPLNERKVWGQSEDVEWSVAARKVWRYKMNADAAIRLLKHKEPWPITNQRVI